jgi:hypothetical protein
MMPEDVAVWERFIEANPEYYDTVEYDYPVGTTPDFVAQGTPEDHATMERLYKKKIDVVAKKDGKVCLIELKPTCTGSTIGQILQYKHLYMRDVSATPVPDAIVICGSTTDDVKEFAATQSVEIIVA